jgi:V-type H+-transporting ATPase subunit a
MGETSRAPSIVNVIINMFLNGGKINEQQEIPLIAHQVFWSKFLFISAIICPPWMLFVKPYLLRRDHEQK